MTDTTDTVPGWLNNALIDGLQSLLVLPLKHRPSADDSDKVHDVWLSALSFPREWDAARDAPAVTAAFQKFQRGSDWPLPADLIAQLPVPKPRLALPPPRTNTMPPEVRAQIDALTKKQRRPITDVNQHHLLEVLRAHIGKHNGISVAQLASALNCTERHVRTLVTELRFEGAHVCGHPATGYFMAANDEELQQTFEFLRSRAMQTLTLLSRMSKVALPDLMGQLRLPT